MRYKYIKFELSMPHRGSWNGKWSQEHIRHLRVYTFCEKDFKEKGLEKLINHSFRYRWNDGWEACISVELLSGARESNRLKKLSGGFCGYDWMIESILEYGEIKIKR